MHSQLGRIHLHHVLFPEVLPARQHLLSQFLLGVPIVLEVLAPEDVVLLVEHSLIVVGLLLGLLLFCWLALYGLVSGLALLLTSEYVRNLDLRPGEMTVV